MAFQHSQRVYFHQADPAGIAFFANVFTCCHTAYEELLRAGGYPLEKLFAAGAVGIPLVHAEADFKRPLALGMAITVTVVAAELKDRSFVLEHTITDEAATVLAVARTAHVTVDRATGKPCAIPDALRAVLKPHYAG